MQNNNNPRQINGTPMRRNPMAPTGRAAPPPARQPQSPAREQRRSGGQQQAPRREPGQTNAQKTKGSRWFRAILMVLATLAACFFLATFILRSASDLFGLNQMDKQIEVVVPEKSTLASVSALLFDKGVIDQPFTFRFYTSLKSITDDELKPGNYIFNSNFSYDQVIAALRTGNTKKEVVWITLIEGSTLYEIAQKLEENKVCSADEFLEYMNDGDIDYEFMNQVPHDPLRYRRLEGYAFPDTYEFYVGMDVPLVADKFLRNLDDRITTEMRDKMRENNLTFDETLVLASIIQKEAGDPVEMRMVASVFLNRLKNMETYPQLQSDVTIHYVDYFIKPFLDRQDQPMYDAYNTYVCKGIPVGAICNPGLDAINAVLDPETSDYYFFVTDAEGTYYYAKTAQTHYANVRAAAAVGDIHGTDTIDERE